jgi:hypothetical protein
MICGFIALGSTASFAELRAAHSIALTFSATSVGTHAVQHVLDEPLGAVCTIGLVLGHPQHDPAGLSSGLAPPDPH